MPLPVSVRAFRLFHDRFNLHADKSVYFALKFRVLLDEWFYFSALELVINLRKCHIHIFGIKWVVLLVLRLSKKFLEFSMSSGLKLYIFCLLSL